MRKTIILFSMMSAAIAFTLYACQDSSAKEKKEKQTVPLDNAAMVKRGEYLVNAIGCDDCHSPKTFGAHGPEVIPALRFSGYPSNRPVQKADSNVVKQGWSMFGSDFTSTVGPWGMSFAANLTSDATGIGNWSEEQFLTAIRFGKFKGMKEGRDLLPPMPWFVYKNLTDEDIRSIFAFLKTTKPVENVVPAPKPFNTLK